MIPIIHENSEDSQNFESIYPPEQPPFFVNMLAENIAGNGLQNNPPNVELNGPNMDFMNSQQININNSRIEIFNNRPGLESHQIVQDIINVYRTNQNYANLLQGDIFTISNQFQRNGQNLRGLNDQTSSRRNTSRTQNFAALVDIISMEENLNRLLQQIQVNRTDVNNPDQALFGLNDRQIGKLKTSTFGQCEKDCQNENIDCPICYVGYEQPDKIRFLKCNHFFHKDCVDVWLKNKPLCPICKKRT